MQGMLSYKGRLKITRTNTKTGLKDVWEFDNMVVAAGRALGVSRVFLNTANPISHVAIGSGTTAPANGDTALQNELARVAISPAPVPSGASVVVTTTFPAGVGTGNISESGLFNASSAGTMFSRAIFTAIPKGALDEISIEWTVSSPAV